MKSEARVWPMKTWPKYTLKTEVVRWHRCRARYGVFDGREENVAYLHARRSVHRDTGTMLIYSRDTGHHVSGWWKNPDYERCWHLSLSFVDVVTLQQRPRDSALTREWLELFFEDDRRLLWCEPPYTSRAKGQDVWHYRLFCDEGWQPIMPRGEVYSRDNTPAHWQSFSEVQDAIARELG